MRYALLVLVLAAAVVARAQQPQVDLSRYSTNCGVAVRTNAETLEIAWPMERGEAGVIRLSLQSGESLIQMFGCAASMSAVPRPVLTNLQPMFFITVGTRVAPTGRPPEMSKWNTFFDNPSKRPHEDFASKLDVKRASVSSDGRRATVSIGDLSIGTFRGELQLTVYPGARLVQCEAVVATEEDDRAYIYDAGLVGQNPGWREIGWKVPDTAKLNSLSIGRSFPSRNVATQHRMIVAEAEHGALACFPPPHQFHFPRDWTDNLKFNWFGQNYRGNALAFGVGIRQVADGGRAFEPWFNAPPGTRQRLGVFYLLTSSNATHAYQETLRYTRNDRFVKLPGHVTFTSHYHMAVAVEAMKRNFSGRPDFVEAFKEMGVDAVHIADFHGDGHQNDPGPLRIPEMEAMMKECRRLSDKNFLVIPGEEISDFLGIKQPGKHPGHWMSLFPKPVHWIQKRASDQPFVTEDPKLGKVYRVGSREDMMRLLTAERGLAWSAHPRIKASSWTPDIFRKEDFYLADYWVGAAWKGMPADLSRERLGERGLDLLDDMANWGQRKHLIGEVDVFKIDRTHELYGHMNINYLRLGRLPRFEDGWQPILDALRHGQFFTTTGEILIREFTLNGKQSGESLRVKKGTTGKLKAELDWTFPLKFAEVITGDGQKVFRERIDLLDTAPFGKRTMELKPELGGRTWVRFEVWDVACNGAFTQPIWLE